MVPADDACAASETQRALVAALDGALDKVEGAEGPCALVLTSRGKFFSNGHDVAWLAAAGPTGATARGGRSSPRSGA